MELSGIELRYLVNEIRSRVSAGYYVSGVNAITKSSLLLKLHHPTHEEIGLVLSTKGIWITRLRFKPVQENGIENAAQSQLERAKVESIEQAGSERIISIRFRHADGKVVIVICEFFGEGNLILCDSDMQITAILNPIHVRHRILNTGLRYAYPPAMGVDVFEITPKQMISLRNESKSLDVLRWIGRSVSMPKKFVEEVVNRTGLQQGKQAAQLSDGEVEKIYSTVKNLVDDVITGKNHQPILIVENDKPVEALPIMTQQSAKMTTKKAASFMEAVDEVMSRELLDVGKSIKSVELDRQIAILEHDLEEQSKAKEAVVQKSAAIRRLADVLMALSYQKPDEKRIHDAVASNSASIVKDKGVKYVEVAGEQIEMDANLARVSSMLFARAKEMERGGASIEQARAKLLMQIGKLKSKTAAIHKKVVVKEQTAKEWYERYRWFVTSDGLLAIGGRDASSNSALVRKHLTQEDIVFHAEVHGSPFFIVKNAAEPAPTGKIDPSLLQVAKATVSFSRAWKDGLSSADAYWVTPEQVKKGAPTGQFLPKGSFVIEGKRNYLKGVEIRLAIGIVQLNGRFTLLCGPEEAIKNRAIFYAVLLQGGMDPMKASKKAKSEFVKIAGNTETAEVIKRISLDDFVRTLPTGQSRISFTARGSGDK